MPLDASVSMHTAGSTQAAKLQSAQKAVSGKTGGVKKQP